MLMLDINGQRIISKKQEKNLSVFNGCREEKSFPLVIKCPLEHNRYPTDIGNYRVNKTLSKRVRDLFGQMGWKGEK